MAYITQLTATPEQEARQQALRYTALISLVLIAGLAFVRFTASPATEQVRRERVDSLQIAYLPLELARPRISRTASVHTATRTHATRVAAPKANYTPRPTPARPGAAPLPGNNPRPTITSNAPSPVEEPKIDERGLYRKVDRPGNGTDRRATTTEGGDPTGSPGGGAAGRNGPGGIGLDLSGFRFGRLSVAADPYDETGRIVFNVKVDASGRILQLTVANTSVSPSVVQWYRNQLEKQRLIPTSSGDRPEVSTGRISLTIKAR
jgi:periplasmic protein TonB